MTNLLRNVSRKIIKKLGLSHKRILDKRVTVGIGTYGINETSFYIWKKEDKIEIGKYCSIAPEVKIIASGEHRYNTISNFPFKSMVLKLGSEFDTLSKGPVIIGNDVWIGYRAIILSGVYIGNGAVIAAGSVVVSDIPDYAVVAGVPARLKKFRFPAEKILCLNKIAWWDWDEKLILERIPDFYTDIDKFIEKYFTV